VALGWLAETEAEKEQGVARRGATPVSPE